VANDGEVCPDPEHVEFGPLRVINEDRVTPEEGFETHGHRDMEINSCELECELAHKDSTVTSSTIRPGDAASYEEKRFSSVPAAAATRSDVLPKWYVHRPIVDEPNESVM
jgi:hypothetical protein